MWFDNILTKEDIPLNGKVAVPFFYCYDRMAEIAVIHRQHLNGLTLAFYG